jgi:hypothetical protein
VSRNPARDSCTTVCREKTVSEACNQLAHTPVGPGERALAGGPVGGRELLYPIERVGASELERVRSTLD